MFFKKFFSYKYCAVCTVYKKLYVLNKMTKITSRTENCHNFQLDRSLTLYLLSLDFSF